jgi:hypothetical protein
MDGDLERVRELFGSMQGATEDLLLEYDAAEIQTAVSLLLSWLVKEYSLMNEGMFLSSMRMAWDAIEPVN